jgi:hypothetical protein
MATAGLSGSLSDFGIADIVQLIGQQQRSGVLEVKSRTEEVEVSFLDGKIVRAVSKTRQNRDLLGTMLVSSGVITEADLAEALAIQKRTLKRLGDILVAEGKVTAEQLRAMTHLQTTETVYALFAWAKGKYAFYQQDVEVDPAQGQPIGTESLLLEGFRRIDEWPAVKKKITSLSMTFKRLRHLDPPPVGPGARDVDVDAALDAALENKDGERVPRSIGRNERLVYKLADPGVTVRRLCDISQLGQFETQKALCNLLDAGFLEIGPSGKDREAVAPTGEKATGARSSRWPPILAVIRVHAVQVGIGIFLCMFFVILAKAFGPPMKTSGVAVVAADASGARRLFVDTQIARLMSALELFRLGKGRYPDNLDELVTERILDGEELKYPFDTQYHYRVAGDSYVLLPPLD